jgi:hypothetical protein
LLDGIAATFGTSLTASGYRFASLTSYAVAIVWSEAGRIRWAKRSDEFGGWLRLREKLDSRTFAADLFGRVEVPAGSHPVPADAWLERTHAATFLMEESRLLPGYGAVLTLLWAKEPLGACRADSNEVGCTRTTCSNGRPAAWTRASTRCRTGPHCIVMIGWWPSLRAIVADNPSTNRALACRTTASKLWAET